jgi:hypothetical protein
MPNRTSSLPLDLELAKARQLLAEGRREEALGLALSLLQQTLGQLRHTLLALHDNLAQLKAPEGQSEASSEGNLDHFPVSLKAGGFYYH